MPRAICPGACALGHMPRAICPGAYAWGQAPGTESITCVVFGGTEAQTIVCVTFGDVTVRVPFCNFSCARANITLAHIWRPETAKKAIACVF